MKNIFVLLSILLGFGAAASDESTLLSQYVAVEKPWTDIQSYSDQFQPVYLSDIDFEEDYLRLATRAAHDLTEALGKEPIQFEVWPFQNDVGQRGWVFARYRESINAPWKWIDGAVIDISDRKGRIWLPKTYDPKREEDRKLIFDDFVKQNDLYAKPYFGNCVWISKASGKIAKSWIHPKEIDSRSWLNHICRLMPQPARYKEVATTFVLSQTAVGRPWQWIPQVKKRETSSSPILVEPHLKNYSERNWSKNFVEAYREDIEIVDGEKEALFPISGLRKAFLRRSSADPEGDLPFLVRYLEERYQVLGIQTERQTFHWRGIEQTNLIAKIPGRLPSSKNKPIILADHIDAAYAEDVYEKSNERRAAPGADDNATATAGLLRAAEIFGALSGKNRPLHDIWLLHLTGEEYPSDCLGARAFVSRILGESRSIGGVVIMDMIGFRKAGDQVFQINAGESENSERLAQLALTLSRRDEIAAQWQPVVRKRFDSKSYLYNTDGVIFSDVGIPTLLINEHINAYENLNRHSYHDTTDTVDKLDLNYASSLLKVAIETVAAAAQLEQL